METVLPSKPVPAEPGKTTVETADFDTLVRVHRPGVYRFLLASLRDRSAADDLTQECFLRAYRARDSFRGEAGTRTWLMQIAVNVLRSHLASERFKFWKRAANEAIDLSEAGERAGDGQRSPEEAALAQQRVAAVWRAAQSLPQQQRTVFFLRFVEDMEVLEIAAATGLAEGTVKAHLYRALEAVRSRVERIK
jgi:RNA polymerase sigma-70 factor (ECF subfamily)